MFDTVVSRAQDGTFAESETGAPRHRERRGRGGRRGDSLGGGSRGKADADPYYMDAALDSIRVKNDAIQQKSYIDQQSTLLNNYHDLAKKGKELMGELKEASGGSRKAAKLRVARFVERKEKPEAAEGDAAGDAGDRDDDADDSDSQESLLELMFENKVMIRSVKEKLESVSAVIKKNQSSK